MGYADFIIPAGLKIHEIIKPNEAMGYYEDFFSGIVALWLDSAPVLEKAFLS